MPALKITCAQCGLTFEQPAETVGAAVDTCARCSKQIPLPNQADLSTDWNEKETNLVAGKNQAQEKDSTAKRIEVPGYTLLSELGRGGMGVVYKAKQINLNRLVALKMILDRSHASADQLARFRGEAEAVAQLQHPNIVRIYEVGQHDGLPFISLEFVNGPTLAMRLSGTLQPVRPAAGLIETLARAIHAAHQRGIIHRDLKPSNILLEFPKTGAISSSENESADAQFYGVPKITDFGLAKRVNDDSCRTQTGAFIGTASYAAPEQAQGQAHELGLGVDVYALGAILYELLTGRPPFKGANAMETLCQVVSEEPVAPRRLQPYVPADLEAICLKCLRKDPRKRYASALDLANDLRRFQDGVPTLARPMNVLGKTGRWCLRNPVPTSLLASFVLCLIFGTWYLSRLIEYLVQSAALESAAQQSDVLQSVNTIYSDVVRRAQAGKLDVTHEYLSKPQSIPIPATFTIELGQMISDRSESGMQIRLYSDYPFRTRRNGRPKDDFERDALQRLTANPTEPFYRFEDYKGRPSLRYATARLMQQNCVSCHNTHPDSIKTDWKVGDLRGVVEVIRPLDADVARIHSGFRGAFYLIGGVCVALLALSGLVFYLNRPKAFQIS